MSCTSSEVAVTATTASIRPVTSVSAPSSTNGASIDGVIELTRRMARRGLKRCRQRLGVPLGEPVPEDRGGYPAGPGDARTLPCGPQIAKIEHARFVRALHVDVGDRRNLAEICGCRRECDVGAYFRRSGTARDSHLEIDGAGRIEGVWIGEGTSGMRSASVPVSETRSPSLAAVPGASRPFATSVVSPTRNSRSSATIASLE